MRHVLERENGVGEKNTGNIIRELNRNSIPRRSGIEVIEAIRFKGIADFFVHNSIILDGPYFFGTLALFQSG